MRGLEVLQPGLLTTVQDLGRSGLAHLGVAPGGAADRDSLRLANLAVGNPPGAAALECTLVGPELVALADLTVAVAGAALGARVEEEALPPLIPRRLPRGGRVRLPGGGPGCRAYLAMAGGVLVPPVLGSRSTDLPGGFGGLEGRPLRRGDRLAVGEQVGTPRRISAGAAVALGRPELRCVRGPHAERFTAADWERLCGEAYRVSPQSDRRGVRLEGAAIRSGAGEIPSAGMAVGAVQVPPAGLPLVLGVDRPPTGGYPVAAVVIRADLPALAQLRPGDPVRFALVEVAQARELFRRREAALAALSG